MASSPFGLVPCQSPVPSAVCPGTPRAGGLGSLAKGAAQVAPCPAGVPPTPRVDGVCHGCVIPEGITLLLFELNE